MANILGRNWRFLVYPDDSLPDNYMRILTEKYQLSGWLSPIHSPDGDIAKPHIHVILNFEGKKSPEQVKMYCDELHGSFPPVNIAKVDNLRAAVRYLIHADNPDKEQFESRYQITCIGGATIDRFFELAPEEYDYALAEMRECIRQNHFTEISMFHDWCDRYKPDWSHLLNTRCYNIMVAYIRSVRHSSSFIMVIDPNSGELRPASREEVEQAVQLAKEP